MWQAKQAEGFVELEQDYARLAKTDDGVKWVSQTVYPETGDMWTSLKKVIPEFFAPKATLNFVCAFTGGLSVFEFPSNSSDKEIENNLQVSRKNFFNQMDELCFKLKKGPINQVTSKRDVIVSYCTKPTMEDIKSLCAATDTKLGKVTTLPDTLIGAMERQYGDFGDSVNLVLQVGYSRVTVLILKGKNVLSVRTLLTGSLRELENILFSGYSLPREDARALISGRHPQPIPALMDTIKENRLDLITHLGGIFAELRGKKLLTQDSQIYLSYGIIDEPGLTQMLGDRFDIKVNILTGMTADETAEKYEDYPAIWTVGASCAITPNLVPPVKISVGNIFHNPATAIIIALIFSLIPLPLILQHKATVKNQLQELKKKHEPIEAMLKAFKEQADYQAKLVSLASQINSDIEKRGISSRIARHLTENLPESTRLCDLNVDYKAGNMKVIGYTVDAESALRYLDTVRDCDELSKPEIVISDLESRRIKFTITAKIGNGAGRK